mmetsp:Transcript_29327/g.46027  ORF Transcript_29327/g.46027 Transcript_29327/m.46027 type:complete len:148 (+) Transcript_29327:199-642(+)
MRSNASSSERLGAHLICSALLLLICHTLQVASFTQLPPQFGQLTLRRPLSLDASATSDNAAGCQSPPSSLPESLIAHTSFYTPCFLKQQLSQHGLSKPGLSLGLSIRAGEVEEGPIYQEDLSYSQSGCVLAFSGTDTWETEEIRCRS